MDYSLRAVHDALRGTEGVPTRWTTLITRIEDRCSGAMVRDDQIADVLRSMGINSSPTRLCMNLRSLRVLDTDDRLDLQRAKGVGIALELAGDSFEAVGSPISWSPVATLPPTVRREMRPPALRQTAGVLLGLIDRSTKVILMAAPFVDAQAMSFLFGALEAARRRGVNINVVTSVGRGLEFTSLDADSNDLTTGRVRITEVRTELSALGSHAKVLVVDDRWAYVGSANLTAAGFGRHVEIGVEVTGPQVEDLAGLLRALERIGTRPFNATVS